MLLTFENVSFAYQKSRFLGKIIEQPIFSDINFCIDNNERVGLMGLSGCGKSTLARIAAGITRQDSGEVRFRGEIIDLENLTQRRAFYTQVQIILQDPISSLNPRLTLMQSLAEPLVYLLSIYDEKAQMERISPLLESLGLDLAILQSYPAMISGGEAQRICLARALLVRPSLLILDEATSNVDYLLSLRILDFLEQWQKIYPCAFLFITHNEHFIERFCQRVLVMQKGKVIETASPSLASINEGVT
ncbi:ABC transporter ATP-binding protein [Helicobacter sp. MIT 05-5293]|uniref:ABC transporter ATP-binding protein n=1 Tax=Helicobacter sp. MIT 05-5293 TaxID=1548149 RepID=UPI00051DFEBA|nr:ABC transporter ATP-binding protein [Helicobacter sp. MIT 05-5293]TLD80482.1 ABC transporter ATP-binding protein [Helicobacter sp. MIT 05-5293]